MKAAQEALFSSQLSELSGRRPAGQVLKWVGNKFRYSEAIAAHLMPYDGKYIEPFVGTGAVLATVAPRRGLAGDALELLIELHQTIQEDPTKLIEHYALARVEILSAGRAGYEEIKARFNEKPNAADLLVLSRTCYGGVVRFTRDGHFSTPMGPHAPMSSEKLARNMDEWQIRTAGVEFACSDYAETMAKAGPGDMIYCDPPYLHGQRILYGAQDFRLVSLWAATADAVGRGARVAVSIDGWRRSGGKTIELGIPDQLFSRELLIERGGCMLRRFQMGGEDMAKEQVADRLLLTW